MDNENYVVMCITANAIVFLEERLAAIKGVLRWFTILDDDPEFTIKNIDLLYTTFIKLRDTIDTIRKELYEEIKPVD